MTLQMTGNSSPTRMCLICLEDKLLSEFQTIRDRCICVICWQTQDKKRCSTCGLEQPLSEFRKLLDSERNFHSHSGVCKRCKFTKEKRRPHTPHPPGGRDSLGPTSLKIIIDSGHFGFDFDFDIKDAKS